MVNIPWIPVILCGLIGVFIFYICPQVTKFRKTIGIDKMLAGGYLPFWQKLNLRMLGFKTPFLTAMGTIFSFILAESDEFSKAGFEQFLSKEHAAMVTAAFWGLSLWSHFSGLQHAASAMPVDPPSRSGKEK